MTGDTIADIRYPIFLVMVDDLALIVAGKTGVAAQTVGVTGLAISVRPSVIHRKGMRPIVSGRPPAAC